MSDRLRMNVLVAARDEYTQQLVNVMLPHMRKMFTTLFNSARESVEKREPNMIFHEFQKKLNETPEWNNSIIDRECTKITDTCKYLIDLVTAVFVTNVKILACVRLGGDSKNLNVKIPSKETFVHKVIIECAENIYYDPFIMDHRLTKTELQHSRYKFNEVVDTSIRDCISKMLPIDEILQEYLLGNLEDANEAESDDSVAGDSDHESDASGERDDPITFDSNEETGGDFRADTMVISDDESDQGETPATNYNTEEVHNTEGENKFGDNAAGSDDDNDFDDDNKSEEEYEPQPKNVTVHGLDPKHLPRQARAVLPPPLPEREERRHEEPVSDDLY
jgi:hypothetical protein